jgi:alpha-glucosidase
MPYIYSLFFEASQTGMPVQRSLAISHPHEPQVYNGLYQHQYLFGPNILVAPVESNKELTKIFLPEGEWFYLYTGKVYSGNQELILDCPIHMLPVFIKGGTVLPMQKSMMNTSEKTDELIVHVYTGVNTSDFIFYHDDGETFQYQRGNYCTRKIEHHNNKVVVNKSEGSFKEDFAKLKFIFHGLGSSEVTVNGEHKFLEQLHHSFFSPLEKYDPINDPDSMGEEWVKTIQLAYSREKIEVSW